MSQSVHRARRSEVQPHACFLDVKFIQVAKEQHKVAPALSGPALSDPARSDSVVLLDSGLDSLCFAIIVARLEDSLGIDPFNTEDELVFPRTLGDFIRMYEDAAK